MADQLREMADQLREMADQLREMADQLREMADQPAVFALFPFKSSTWIRRMERIKA